MRQPGAPPSTASRGSGPRQSRGFTLVEVLVALLIMAVIAAMGWQGVSGMARAREIGTAASERTLRLSAVMGQWEQDLAAIYDSDKVPGISFDGASLRLVRRSEGGVQVVVWGLRDGVWQRWPGPVVQRSGALQQAWMASQQLQGAEPEQLRLLDGVTGWQLYFWRGQGWSNAQSSADQATVADDPAAAPPPTEGSGTATGGTGSQNGGAGAQGGTGTAGGNGTQAGGAGTQTGTQAGGAGTQGGTGTQAGTGTPGGGGAPAPRPTQRTRSLLPEGVRLQIDLPEGQIQRDVMLSPTS